LKLDHFKYETTGARRFCQNVFFQLPLNSPNVIEGMYPPGEYLRALCWVSSPQVEPGESQRNRAFPTWSWTGWNGKILYHFTKRNITGTGRITSTVAGIELSDRDIMSWEQYHDLYPKLNSSHLSHFVHIAAPTVQIYVLRSKVRTDSSIRKWICRLDMDDGCYILLALTIEMASLHEGAKLNGLILAESMLQFTDDSRKSGQDISILVVAKTEGRTERVGGQWLYQGEKLYDADGKFLGGNRMYILETNRSGIVFFKDNMGSIGVSIWSLQCRLFVLGSQSNNPIHFFSTGMKLIN